MKCAPSQTSCVRTGFIEHLALGALSAAALAYVTNSALALAPEALAVPSAAFAFSSIVPDVDSASSRPRRYFRAGAASALAVISLFFYAQLSSIHPLAPFAFPPLAFFAIELFIPRHRGILHSPSAALAWGALALLLSGSFLVSSFAACGYLCHLATDYFGDRV